MSTINFITATQPPIPAMTRKSAAPQILATSSQPKANASSSVTISPSGTIYMNYEQQMAQHRRHKINT